MTTRTKGVTKNVVFITKAIESLEDPLHEGEFPVYKWSIQMWGEREDGSWEDPSYYISRVAFELHPSFTKSRRVLAVAPYTVREKGWGEFEIGAEIVFTDPSVPHFQTQIQLLFDPVSESRVTIPFKNISASFKQTLAESGSDAPQQPSSQTLHPVPMGLTDVCAVRNALSSMVDQEKLKQFLQLVQEAAQNDKLINVAVESAEEGGYSDYSFNLYDLPLDFLQRVSLLLGPL